MTNKVPEKLASKMSTLRRLRKQGNDAGDQPSFKVVVFGQPGVGKTAFIVRCVTKRFIGEYDPTLAGDVGSMEKGTGLLVGLSDEILQAELTKESIYQRSLTIPPNHSVFLEIMDTSGQKDNPDDVIKEKIKWADGFILLYSVTDRASFNEISRKKFLISHIITNGSQKRNHEPVTMVVGNKKDLEMERLISTEEGAKLATNLSCFFREISVRESVDEVTEVFESLYRAWRESEKSGPARPKSGNHVTYFDLPIMQHHFPTLQSKRKQKSFKHIDRMPRMRSSLGVSWQVVEHLCEASASGTPRTPSLSSSPVSQDTSFLHSNLPLSDGEVTAKRRNFKTHYLTSSDSDAEHRRPDSSPDNNFPQNVAKTNDTKDDTKGQEAVELSPYDNSSSDSCVEDSYGKGIINSHQVAKDFSRKTMLLSLE